VNVARSKEGFVVRLETFGGEDRTDLSTTVARVLTCMAGFEHEFLATRPTVGREPPMSFVKEVVVMMVDILLISVLRP
jgi:hypothetical protein